MNVSFSDLARAGLLKAEPQPDRRKSVELSIKLHLRHPEATSRCVRLPEIGGRALYLYPLWKFRVTWELAPDDILVWSIGLLREHKR